MALRWLGKPHIGKHNRQYAEHAGENDHDDRVGAHRPALSGIVQLTGTPMSDREGMSSPDGMPGPGVISVTAAY